MAKQFLVFDVGSTGTKAAIMTAKGQVIASSYSSYETQTPQENYVEQNANDWWQAVLHTASELDLSAIEAIAVTGQMQNVILIDEDSEVVRPVILYSDMRSQAESDFVNTTFGRDRLKELTANEQTAGSLLAKLCWLNKHETESLDKAKHLLLGAADYIAFKLTGNAVSDTTTASTTGLLQLEARAFLNKSYFDNLGLLACFELLPKLLAGGSQVGNLTEAAKKQLNIKQDITVYLGPGDAVSTTLGVGSGVIAKPYAYIGTSGWVAYTSLDKANPDKGVFTLAHPDKDKVVCIAPLLTAGANFDWIKNITGESELSTMISAAVAKPMSRLIYLPYLNGERSPFSDPLARGSFIGLNASHDKYDLIRAVLEGVIFAYRHALETLVSDDIDRIMVTGGGARSTDIAQLLADVTGIGVDVLPEEHESGILGTLLSIQKDNVSLIEPNLSLNPDQIIKVNYDGKFDLYLEAYDALSSLFMKMGSLKL